MSTDLVKIEKTVASLQSIKDIKKQQGTYLLCDVSSSMMGEKIEGLLAAVNQLQFPFNRIISFNHEVTMGLRTMPSGTTALHRALPFVYALNPKKIILISDGQPDNPQAVLEIVSPAIPIDIIYISDFFDNDAGKAFMEKLAKLTGGRHANIDDYKNDLEMKLIGSIKGFLKG